MSDQNWLNEARFKKFSLRRPGISVLPERHSLVVDRLTGMLVLVDWQAEQIIEICNDLTEEQIALVLYLLEMWPSCALYEEMLSKVGLDPTPQQREDFARIRGMVGDDVGEQAAYIRVSPSFVRKLLTRRITSLILC